MVREILRVVRPAGNLAPTNAPIPKSITSIFHDDSVEVTLSWDYTQGEIPADRFIIFQSRGKQLTDADSSAMVAVTSRTHIFNFPKGRTYSFRIAAARGMVIGKIVQPTNSPDWEIST
jgi:hypothetical protein